ncbi:MAG: hypothetical protein WC788_01885 [Candidatus Paceibacterota bacterium]
MWTVKGINGKVFFIKGGSSEADEQKDAIRAILRAYLDTEITLEDPEPGLYELIVINSYSHGGRKGCIYLKSEGIIFVGNYIPSKDESIEDGIHFEEFNSGQSEKLREFLRLKQV